MEPFHGEQRAGGAAERGRYASSLAASPPKAAARNSSGEFGGIKSNVVILAIIGLMSLLGVAAIAIRFVFATLFDVVGFALPPYTLTITFVSLVALVLLFPAAVGRTVTAILARRVGFVSLKMEALDFWNMRADGIVINSPRLGLITCSSLGLRPDWSKRFLKINISGLKVDGSNGSILKKGGAPAGKRSTKRNKRSPLGYLRFFRFVEVNLDAFEVTVRNISIKTRDITALLRIGERTHRSETYEQLVLAHASLGMLTVTVSEVEDNAPGPASPAQGSRKSMLQSHHPNDEGSHSKVFQQDRLTNEDDLFPELKSDAKPSLASPSSKRKLFSESRATTSLRILSMRTPPLIELNRVSLWLHVPKTLSASDLMEAEYGDDILLPVDGVNLDFAAIKLCASAAPLLNLVKFALSLSKDAATSAAPVNAARNAAKVAPSEKNAVTDGLAALKAVNADPVSLTVGMLDVEWYDSLGPSLTLGLVLDMELSSRGGLKATLNKPVVSAVQQSNSSAVLGLELLSIGGALTDRTSIVLNALSVQATPTDLQSFERAHIELLRLHRQVLKIRESLLVEAGSQKSQDETSARGLPEVNDEIRPTTTFVDMIEFAVTEGVSVKLYTDTETSSDIVLKMDTFVASLSVLNQDAGIVTEGLAISNNGDVLFSAERFDINAKAGMDAKVDFWKPTIDIGAAPIVRVYSVWRRFAPRISHWRENSQAMKLVTSKELRKGFEPRPPPLKIGTSKSPMSQVSVTMDVHQINFRFFLVERKGVSLRVPLVKIVANPQRETKTLGTATLFDIALSGFDEETQNQNTFVSLKEMKLDVESLSRLAFDMNGLDVFVSSKEGPFPGELMTAYFKQRKAITLAMKEIFDDTAYAIPTTLPLVGSAGASSSLLSPFGDQALSTPHQNLDSSNADSDFVESAELIPDVDKIAITVSITDVCFRLEDDNEEDDPIHAARGFFDHHRSHRESGMRGEILRVTIAHADASFLFMTAWKSRAGPSSDASLLKRSVLKSQRTRAHMLRVLQNIDAFSCPASQLDRALMHGMGDLVGFEFKACLLGRTIVQLSDYPNPIMRFEALDLCSKSKETRCTRLLFADLRPVPCSTRIVQVELSEINSSRTEAPLRITSTSNFIPMKTYFDLPSGTCAGFSAFHGENHNPAIMALDRALGRLLPSGSDTKSRKLGWWDKVRYMMHGRMNILFTSGCEFRILTGNSPFDDGSYLSFGFNELVVMDHEEEGAKPIIGVDQRMWSFQGRDWTIKMARPDIEDGKAIRFISVPVVKLILAFGWRATFGGGHYVQLHHGDVESPDQIEDQYAHFRSTGLDLGLDFECLCASTDDYAPKDKYPSWEWCWRVVTPLLFHTMRGMVPPVPPSNPDAVTIGRLMKKIHFNVRADRPHILWYEDRAASLAFLLRGNTVDSRVTFVRKPETNLWHHHAVLSQYAAVEAYMLHRTFSPPGSKRQTSSSHVFEPMFGEEFGMADYAFGIGFGFEPFACAPAMRLTLGQWRGLLNVVEDASEGSDVFHLGRKTTRSETFSTQDGNMVDDLEEDDSHDAYRLCVDESRMIWTLAVRDETFRFFGTVTYIIRKELRLWDETARKFNPALVDRPAYQMDKSRIRRMDLSWLWHRRVADPPRDEEPGNVSSRMSQFLSMAKDQKQPIVSEDTFVERQSGDALRERPPACSNAQVSADGLKSTWDEIYREYTLELRWPQVSLISDRSVVVLATRSATIRTFRLGLLDMDEDATLLVRKEMDVEVRGAEVHATFLSEHAQPGARFIVSMRQGEPYCLDPGVNFDCEFASARGCLKRSIQIQQHHFTERVANLIQAHIHKSNAAPGDHSKLAKTAISEMRRKRVGPLFFDICSRDQDPTLARVGHSDSFHVTDVVYTDTTGGAKVPSSHLGMRLEKSFASIRSRDFFAVLVVVRDLLLVGPPADVKELVTLAEQEALEELKRRYKQSRGELEDEKVLASFESVSGATPTTPQKATGPNALAEKPKGLSDMDLRILQTHVENVLLHRPGQARLLKPSQRIVYELLECDWKLTETDFSFPLPVQGPPSGASSVGGGSGGLIVPFPSSPLDAKQPNGRDVSPAHQSRSGPAGSGLQSATSSVNHALSTLKSHQTAEKGTAIPKELQSASDGLRLQIFNMRGDHLFSLDRSTRVEFEVGGVQVYDLNDQPVLEVKSNDANTPFLRADAITSPPIIANGCRVTVYELIQAHLFPGSTGNVSLTLTQQTAVFVRKYITEDDADNGPLPPPVHLPISPSNAPHGANTEDESEDEKGAKLPRRAGSLKDDQDLGAAAQVPNTSARSGLLARMSSELTSHATSILPGTHLSGSGLVSAHSSTASLTGLAAQQQGEKPTAGQVGGGRTGNDTSRVKRFSQAVTRALNPNATSSNSGQMVVAANVGAKPVPAPSAAQDDGPSAIANDAARTASSVEGQPVLGAEERSDSERQATTMDADADEEVDDSADALNENAFESRARGATLTSAVSGPEQPSTSSSYPKLIRYGHVLRLSVPKALQANPEPTVQAWSQRKHRRNVLALVVRKGGQAVLELHNNEYAMKLKLQPRAVIPLSEIYFIRRTQDSTAPEHAIDVFYHERSTSGVDGDAVFTWAAEEKGLEWQGRAAALPWIASIAPGIGRNTIDPSLQRELAGPSLEYIFTRSVRVIRGPQHGVPQLSHIVGPRRFDGVLGAEGDQMTDDNSDNSSPANKDESPAEGAAVQPIASSLKPKSPANANNPSTKQVFFANEAAPIVPSKSQTTTASQPQQSSGKTEASSLINLAYFKYVRIGQIHLNFNAKELRYQNVSVTLRRSAFCTPTVEHGKLWTWSKAFKHFERRTSRKLMLSALSGRAASGPSAETGEQHPSQQGAMIPAGGDHDLDDEEEDYKAPSSLRSGHGTRTSGVTSWFRKRAVATATTASTNPSARRTGTLTGSGKMSSLFLKSGLGGGGGAASVGTSTDTANLEGEEAYPPTPTDEGDAANYERLFGTKGHAKA